METSSRYRIATFELPAAGEELLVAALWAAGSAGSWIGPDAAGRTLLQASFDTRSTPADESLRALASRAGARLLGIRDAPEVDWHAAWRESAGPIEIGTGFVVDPREPGAGEPAIDAGARSLLRLPARTAFGVGSHESTRLAVELLESVPVAGRRVVDVGTGTGILAFVARRLGARTVVALDTDLAAALLLPQSMALNGMRLAAFCGGVDALDCAGRPFDLALANVVPSEIGPDLKRLEGLLAPGARAIFSGVLVEQSEAALETLARYGFHCEARLATGAWVAFSTERTQ